MARRSGKHEKPFRLPKFVPFFLEILESTAYHQLPFAAAKVLPYFLGKLSAQRLSPADSEYFTHEFSFSYTEAASLGFAKATFARVLVDLCRHGLLDIASKGGLRSTGRTTTKYKLSSRYRVFGTAGFQEGDWRRFFGWKDNIIPLDGQRKTAGQE